MFVASAEKALAQAGCRGSDVDTIVTISSTGVATPSLEASVAGRMGFRADVERVPVFGLGCAGGVYGLAIASRLACSRPGSIVLRSRSKFARLAFRLDELTKANIVATALFGDGAAACILRAADAGPASVEMSGQHIWPDTLDIMGWNIDDQGLRRHLRPRHPALYPSSMSAPAIAGILARMDWLPQLDRSLCLSSRRREGHHGTRDGAVARAGFSRP